jgi:SM-20-related protein
MKAFCEIAPPEPISTVDELLVSKDHERIISFLKQPSWGFGWKSNSNVDAYSFWHKHFGGSLHPDPETDNGGPRSDCEAELLLNAPVLHKMWTGLKNSYLKSFYLCRCYANAQPYGTDGSVHVDSTQPNNFTAIYYPCAEWDANWGGETVFFNRQKTDIIRSVYPKPNRFVMFPGNIPHVARGVSRTCPEIRITLMFKVRLIGTLAQAQELATCKLAGSTMRSGAVRLREGRAEDVAAVQAVERAARTRYLAISDLAFVAAAPPLSAERIGGGNLTVAEYGECLVGFVLTTVVDQQLYVANVSVAPDAAGSGIGAALIQNALDKATYLGLSALTLTTFLLPPWNAHWFTRLGFTPMPDIEIGTGLRQIMHTQAKSVDPKSRTTMWRRTPGLVIG